MWIYNFKATPVAAFSRPICYTNSHALNFNNFHVFNLNFAAQVSLRSILT